METIIRFSKVFLFSLILCAASACSLKLDVISTGSEPAGNPPSNPSLETVSASLQNAKAVAQSTGAQKYIVDSSLGTSAGGSGPGTLKQTTSSQWTVYSSVQGTMISK